ncbi:acetyltransferase [Sphingomonas sp. R-74633]|nr:acetyltransferase [Sphingomonas sp. R-74633]
MAIIGAGGHAVVVADALQAGGSRVECFLETDPAKVGAHIFGIAIVQEGDFRGRVTAGEVLLVNGIGGVRSTAIRRRAQEAFERDGWRFVGVRHPSAIVSEHAEIEETAQLLAGSVVQPGAQVGRGCIVNTRSVVEHDCQVGDWSHIAPAAVLCGDVILKDGCHIGASATVLQGRSLGPETVVGAGAVVTRDFEGYGTLTGVPARIMGQLQ